MKKIKFFEYSGFVDEDGNEECLLSQSNLTENEISHLKLISESAIPGKEVFDIGSSKIKATSMVGVISFGNVQIEILPKLLRYKNDNEKSESNSILKNLMFMLSYTHSLEVNDVGIGSLAESSDSFIEAYISIFANRLSRNLIRFGPPKAYIEKSENLNTIKGKIVFSKQSTINCFNQSKVYCNYSDFTENNNLSKAFKFVALSLKRLTANSNTISVLNRCVGLLDGVDSCYVNADELTRVATGKRDPNFIALINLTKMFLKKLRPEFSGQSKNKVFSLLFDMNDLFEEFIYRVLKENEKNFKIEVASQKRKKLVSAEKDYLKSTGWIKKNIFDTYTDINVKFPDGRLLVIDTKYKIVHSDKSHYGINNQDVYQVLAYKQIHTTNMHTPAVALLYPKSKENIQKEFQINGSPATFIAWTIDISKDLKNNMNILVNDLGRFINK